MGRMHNPPHPGGVLQGLWLEPAGVSITAGALALGCSRKHISSIINGRAAITADYCGYGAAFGCVAEDSAGIVLDDAGDVRPWQASGTARRQIKALKLAA